MIGLTFGKKLLNPSIDTCKTTPSLCAFTHLDKRHYESLRSDNPKVSKEERFRLDDRLPTYDRKGWERDRETSTNPLLC